MSLSRHSSVQRLVLPLALFAALIAAPALAEPIDGTVTSREKIILPKQVAVVVRLFDLGRNEHEVTQQRIRPRGRQLPIPFRLHFDPAKVKAGHHYTLDVEIIDGDKTIFADRDAHPIDLTKIAGPVTLYVRPVSHDGKPDGEEKPAPAMHPAPPKAAMATPAKPAPTATTAKPAPMAAPAKPTPTPAKPASAPEKPAAAPALIGATWHAEAINGHDLPEANEPTLEIAAGGQVTGFSACNRYSGTAQIDGAKLSFGPLAMTRMACAPAPNAIEADFAKAMEAVKGYRIESGKLALTGEAGTTLIRFGRK